MRDTIDGGGRLALRLGALGGRSAARWTKGRLRRWRGYAYLPAPERDAARPSDVEAFGK